MRPGTLHANFEYVVMYSPELLAQLRKEYQGRPKALKAFLLSVELGACDGGGGFQPDPTLSQMPVGPESLSLNERQLRDGKTLSLELEKRLWRAHFRGSQ